MWKYIGIIIAYQHKQNENSCTIQKPTKALKTLKNAKSIKKKVNWKIIKRN